MCGNKNNCRNRNLCAKHKTNKQKKPETIKLGSNRIPIVPMDQLPEPNKLKNGSVYLVGDPIDPAKSGSKPNANNYQFAISNGDYYIAFSPTLLLA